LVRGDDAAGLGGKLSTALQEKRALVPKTFERQ
jgi:hypothetical protein